ncbi:MAG: hypothetical protein HGA49_00250 [Eubacteriaceae bacterium]|nr:hypothetical protein [Eubacteriaceae bacterium]
MKALFGRKVSDLEELRELTRLAREAGQKGQNCRVKKEVVLDAETFDRFAKDFFIDWDFITELDGGMNKEGEILCIRVINQSTNEKILINNEGHTYSRYTAIED